MQNLTVLTCKESHVGGKQLLQLPTLDHDLVLGVYTTTMLMMLKGAVSWCGGYLCECVPTPMASESLSGTWNDKKHAVQLYQKCVYPDKNDRVRESVTVNDPTIQPTRNPIFISLLSG
jgi:hypothetical protein